MSITYQPKKRKRQKTHGFLKRTNSKSGRKIIKQRRRKNRKNLAV
jgi:large subunit ribosomal protein L34